MRLNKITISERAKKEIIKLINDKKLSDTAGLRLSIKAGGCSGFEYNCSLAENSNKFDEIFEFGKAKVIVDKKSLFFATGTHIDYKTALMGSGFQFSNPNATGSCGCGVSFSV